MSGKVTTVAALVLLPLVVFLGGVTIMSAVSGRPTVRDPKPLNQRWLGYGVSVVDVYWRALGPAGRKAELTFLKLDLLFPVFYGGTLAVSLLAASALVGGAIPALWLAVPVALGVVADWTENLTQLDQLQRYIQACEAGAPGLDALAAGWIRVASIATIVKLVSFTVAALALVVLVFVLLRGRRRG